jgi:hypothetical protein
MAHNNRNWLDSIKKLPGWITGFIAFVTAGLVTIVLLVAGVGGGTLGCAYLAFKMRGRLSAAQIEPLRGTLTRV